MKRPPFPSESEDCEATVLCVLSDGISRSRVRTCARRASDRFSARCASVSSFLPPLPAPPPPQYPPELGPNIVLHDAPGVGSWTGWCTCPNGERYAVGDQYNGCGSLACIGGSSSDCSWESGRPHAHGARTQVTCAASGDADSCGLRLQVQETGFVSLVQEDTSDTWLGSPGPGRPDYGRWSDRFAVDSGEVWRVRWEGGAKRGAMSLAAEFGLPPSWWER